MCVTSRKPFGLLHRVLTDRLECTARATGFEVRLKASTALQVDVVVPWTCDMFVGVLILTG